MKREFGCILLFLLLLLTACDGERSREMSALLDRADSLNRAFVPMTGGLDSLLRDAADYYDRHGTSNEQMRAHYLLGCAYRDMGEAPAALQSYQDAVDRADTTSADCDMKRLMSVYGQMSTLFHYQNLPTDELEANYHVQSCAEKLNDTLTYIRCIELKVRPYYLLHDTASMLRALHQAQQLYLKHGYAEEAASVYPPIIDIYISRDSLEAAKKLMDVFETKSGLFDAKGNISAGRENYYELKGLYHIKNNKLDSAEYCFRRLMQLHLMTGAYRGLLSVYKSRMNTDSIVKYAQLYEDAVNQEQETLRTQTVHQMSSLYNYQRFKEKAEREEQQAGQARNRLWSGSILVGIFFVVCMLFAYQYRKRKKEEIVRLYSDYLAVLSKYNKSTDELRLMKEDTKQYEDAKQQDLEMMRRQLTTYKEQLATYKDQLDSMKTSEILSAFSRSDIVMSFHRKAAKTRNVQLPDNAEWRSLYKTLTTEIPLVSTLIGGERILSVKELHVCLLLILGFSNTEIYKLVDLTPQHFSNLKRIINRKLFGDDSATTIENNIKQNLTKV